ncbi:MAG: HD domain-containing protein [Armatimonadota bacterium]|nr:HD domain-containing protein [Armatimonadota bacterium]
MQEQRKAYRLFRIGIIALCAAVILAVILASDPKQISWSRLFIFLAVAMVCEFAPIELGRDYCQFSLSLPIVILVMLLYGTLPAVIISGAAFFLANAISWLCAHLADRFPVPPTQKYLFLYHPRAIIFRMILPWIGRPWIGRHNYPINWILMLLVLNAAHSCISTACAAAIYSLAGGLQLGNLPHHLSTFEWMRIPLAGAAAMLVWLAVDIFVYVIESVLYENLPAYTKTMNGFLMRCNMKIRQTLPEFARGYITLGILATVLAYLYMQIGVFAILVLFGPFYMFRDATKQTVEQLQSYRDTVTALGTYMQRYHPYTRGHLQRVANLSERLAKELKLNLGSVMLMPDAGMLHDIGKVGVSEDILDKVGRLTDEEWTIIKQHPVKGAEIVSNLPYLGKIVDWIKYHHKWADGSGYPDDGAKDGQIPVEAAIIAVVDAFDAMTDDREMSVDWVCDSCGYIPENGNRPEVCPQCGMAKKRVYRQPLSLDEAIDQLRRGAGTQFSPPVVKAFLRMLERDGVHISA